MFQIPFDSFLNKVLTSTERVQFSHVDPYGHLNTSRYVEYFLNHRIHAAEEQLQCLTMDLVKELSVGFVVQEMSTRFLLPCFQGETLEIASWVSQKSSHGFTLSVIMSSMKNHKAKACGRIQFVSVDMKTGRPIALPQALPSRAESDLTVERPTAQAYLEKIVGKPEDFQ